MRYTIILDVHKRETQACIADEDGEVVAEKRFRTSERSYRRALKMYGEGSLVSSRVFLTAGHCVEPLIRFGVSPDGVFVTFSVFLEDRRSWRAVSGWILHPEYFVPIQGHRP
jgi:hypothetical protein